ncbi:hypothetical protein [Streptomyces sp. ICN441]|uniref:hypothetical protein n=1 Tax=Streptomyces sp. ICN441 TaxID=2558286 RepID=UPI001F116613|nr:hypothetical protein [Streptomyces sp. ICN441]
MSIRRPCSMLREAGVGDIRDVDGTTDVCRSAAFAMSAVSAALAVSSMSSASASASAAASAATVAGRPSGRGS